MKKERLRAKKNKAAVLSATARAISTNCLLVSAQCDDPLVAPFLSLPIKWFMYVM